MTLDEIREATLNFLRRRKGSYQQALMSPAGQEVLIDLAKFCRANEPTFDPDPRIHALLEGRREVWLRIQQHLNLSSDQLYQLYNGLRALKQDNSNG